MTSGPPPSLRQVLGLRLAGTALAAVLSLAVVLGVVYTVQRDRLDEAWRLDAQAHFERQTSRLDADWLRQAEQLRAQIEFTGVLDGDDERLAAARLTAFLANLGGQGTFTHVLVLDGSGRRVAGYATRTADAIIPAGRAAQSWSYAEADGLVYRVLRAPIRLGSRGAGELLLFVPLNNALISAIAIPDARIGLRWQSQGETAGHDSIAASSAASSAGGPRLVEGRFSWAGAPGGPELQVLSQAREILPPAELLPIAAAGVGGGALLAWLVIGRWAQRHVRRIDTVSAAVDAFASGRRDAAALGGEVIASSRGGGLELQRLGEGLDRMMRATEAAVAARELANRELAELNATLEQRVARRTQELAVARDEALTAARARQQILAGVSHELRTPLVGLLGSLELADIDGLPPEPQRLLGVARRSGQALRNIIDDVLDYSRLEAVGAELRKAPFRVDDLAAEAVGLHAAVALNKGLRLHCDCAPAAARTVRGDPVRLRQVLLNLVGNAVKFTDQGRVDLRVTARPAPAGDAFAVLRFEVEDTGIGIDEAARQRLFDPFMQADAAQSRQRGGTGLGLAIAQRLITAMGGQIEARSRPGEGSCFWFELELPLAEADAPAAPLAGAPVRLHGRVLVVEDNPVNRMIATEMLRRLGLEVEESENGLLAIESLRQRPVDVVLMDHQMPVLDGPATTARIRAGDAGEPLAGVPIIAITAHAQDGDAEACLAAGMSDYLAKPFSQAELGAVLERWLQPRVEARSEA